MDQFGRLNAVSAAMRLLFESARRLADSDMSVLLIGETGTGKSSLARAMHDLSPRKTKPFVVFDCASVAPSLVESALFGHARGAFTGADKVRIGALELAEDGTLFIDELSELPLDLQPKLLRALEERIFSRLGDGEERPVRCRVVAAAQASLLTRVQAGQFRLDLYYRVAVASLAIPPLRERKDDIPMLVDQLFALAGDPAKFAALPEPVRRRLLSHQWTGNVRELRNVVDRLRLSGSDDLDLAAPATTLEAPARPTDDLDFTLSYSAFKKRYVAQLEHAYVLALMSRANGNVSRAAQLARMGRRHLYRLLDRFGLKSPADESTSD